MKQEDAKNMFKKVSSHNVDSFIDIVPDYVSKKVLSKGFGSKLAKEGDEILVHYVGELKNDKRTVDNTYMHKEPHCCILGKNSITYGLELAIKTMKIGEKALVLVEPEYGHLPLEQFKDKVIDKKYLESPLSIDFETKDLDVKDAKKYLPIIYEVDLLFIDKPRKDKSQLNTEEKIEIAMELKQEGICCFRKLNYQEAEKYFLVALEYLTKIPSNDLKKIEELLSSLNLNICNCLIHLNQYNSVLKRLEEAFKIKVTCKCFYYRALAHMHLGDFEKAEFDIKKIADYIPETDPTFKEIKNKLENCKEEYNKKTSKLIKGSINSSLYEDKASSSIMFPSYSNLNKVIYLDFIKNEDTKTPIKIKFEIYRENWADKIVKMLSSNVEKKVNVGFVEEKSAILLGYYENDDGLESDFEKLRVIVEREIANSKKIVNLQEKRKALNTMYNIFPCSINGLLCYSNKNLFISLEPINEEIIENILVLGKIFFNNHFLEDLTKDDSLSLISQGISLNIN